MPGNTRTRSLVRGSVMLSGRPSSLPTACSKPSRVVLTGARRSSCFGTKRDLDLVPNFQWMIQSQPAELTSGDFERIMDRLGDDSQQAERFINVFSHAVSGSEFFGRLNAADLLGGEPNSLDTAPDVVGRADNGGTWMTVEDRILELGYRLGMPPPPLGKYVRCVVSDGYRVSPRDTGPLMNLGTSLSAGRSVMRSHWRRAERLLGSR